MAMTTEPGEKPSHRAFLPMLYYLSLRTHRRVKERSLIDADMPWALIVRNTNRDFTRAGATHAIVRRKGDVIDATVSRHLWIACSLRPYPCGVCSYSPTVWTRVAATRASLFHRFILPDAINSDANFVTIRISDPPDSDGDELMIRWP